MLTPPDGVRAAVKSENDVGHAAEGTTCQSTTQSSEDRKSVSNKLVCYSPLVISPHVRWRAMVGVTRAGWSVACGLLPFSSITQPLLAVAFAAYESLQVVRDYHTEVLSSLGCRTDLADVAFSAAKELGTAATGLAVGYAVGSLVGLGSMPVLGQLLLTAIISATVGYCVTALLTHYADRIFVRLKLQRRYGYSRNEQKARERFEQLLELQHDLSSFETCKIVQHYRDYRVACGWESVSDIDHYRSTADISTMPVSFQHFAVVQLQRKWGFLNERDECKKVYRALLLLHHPDKGGSAELTAQLTYDFEVYAFCQQWRSNVQDFVNAKNPMQSTKKSTSVRRGKGGFVVGFLRQLFQSEKNSTTNAEDLHENGLLALEAGTPLQLHELDKLSRELMERNEEDDGEVEKWDNASLQRPYRCTSASVKQHSVSRVLASVQRHYQLATEAIPFAGLVELNKKPMEWEKLKRDVYLFIRLHAFTQVVDELIAKGNGTTPRTIEHSYLGFRWRTKSEAREKREEVRMSIITVSFPTNVTKQLTEALELWRTAQSVVQSFSKHCSNGDDSAVEAAVGLTLETLLSIQQSLQALAERKVHSLEEGGDVFWGGCDALQQPLVEELRFVGRVASCALAGAYAVEVHEKVRQECEEYFRGRANKMESVRTLLNEMYDLRQQMAQATTERCSELRDRLNEHMEEFFMLHQTLAEADGAMSNLCDMYTVHLPENANVLWTFPSSCVKCVGDQFHMPRFFRYERERTLADYTNVEEEPRNAVEPCKTPVDRGILFNGTEGCGKVGFTLLRAQLVDSVKGTVSNCWLKRYTFPVYEETTTRHQAVEIFRSLMERELSVHESCATHRVTCATEVFCEADARVVYFHVPKGRTQMRFNSTHDVGKRIARLGAKWLHDALQCIIDLHSCHLVHEDINLSCFTYDDFGNTTLGFFSNVLWDSKCGRKSALEDTVDFGALLHAEVLPYLRAGSPTAEPVHPQRSTDRCEKVQSAGFAVYQNRLRRCEETIDLFEEVASRLIGKLEPRWDLLDARAFVRRFLEINSDEREYLFSKEISYPPHWASWKGIVPVSMIPERWALCQLMPESTTVFLNRNVHLWEIYWKRRRKMVKNRGGGSFSMPAELKTLPCFLPCSDDCEVNERFLWYTCGSEEEAWTICLKGCDGTECVLSVSPPPMHDSKRAGNGNASVAWGVVFRVSLGTVVVGAEENVSDCGLASGTSPLPSVDCAIKNMRCNPVLIKRGSNSSASYDVVVFSPKQHCYPEYLVHWLQN